MRSAVVAALLGTALAAAPLPSGQNTRPSSSLERTFSQNGRIRMNLSAGDYRISGSPDARIRLDWSVRDADQLSKVSATADVRQGDAVVTTDGPTNQHVKFVIQVPARSDLYLRLTAGDLRVDNVQGNKDIELHAGDARIDVGRAEDYHHVDASIWAGDLHAAPFRVSKEGLFRSFEWKGKGPYKLHAHLKAGDLELFSKDGSQP